MSDSKRDSMKKLNKAFPRTKEGFADLLHAQLYFKYIPLYIYHMKKGLNNFMPEPLELFLPEDPEFDAVDEMVQAAVNRTGALAADPDTNAYHAKVLRLEEAEQLVSLQEDIDLGELPKSIIPYENARRIVFENPKDIAVIDCVCRTLRGDQGCYPRGVCILIGDPWVSWALEREKHLNGHRITQEEALQILRDEHERGHVHAAFFKDAAAGRLYHICNCCQCCCTALHAQNYVGAPMFAGSGFVAKIDPDTCACCEACVSACNFNAISMAGGKAVVDPDACHGCQACRKSCSAGAISFEALGDDVLAPLDMKKLMEK